MPVIRNKLSSLYAGGPRQFAELQDRLLIVADDERRVAEIRSELDKLNLQSRSLQNAPVIIAEAQGKIEDTLDRAREIGEDTRKIRDGIDQISNADDKADAVVDATDSIVAATQNFITQVRGISAVDLAEFVRTEADYGPENLRIDVKSKRTLGSGSAKEKKNNIRDMNEAVGVVDGWKETRGEGVISVIFDTGFAEDLIATGRTRETFSSGGANTAYASAEGHGTMCAGTMAANNSEGVPFNGVLPNSEVILVRITDDQGQIRSDIISEAWDWIANLNTDKPMVINHSYGTPLCSGRPKNDFCNTAANEVIRRVNSDKRITSVYAAGNEAMRCGHRPAGFTNAITGTNSLDSVITVGALLSNGRDAQRYSSHGRGDCAPIADPKPNVTCRIPMVTYYGGEDGWKLKDMSTGVLGSGGGTSEASPRTAGIVGMLQSKAYERDGSDGILETEEIKQILESTAKQPRRTQINSFGFLFSGKGYDARFGNGEVRADKALQEV